MRVCLIASCASMGGAERALMETIDVLVDRGIECRVLVPGDGELAEELRNAGVPYAFVRRGAWISWRPLSAGARIKYFLGILIASIRGLNLLAAWRCDVVVTNTLTLCYGSIIARVLRLPHLWYLHEFGADDHGVSYVFGERLTKRFIGLMSSTCIVASRALASDYERFIPRSKLNVIYYSMHRANLNDNALVAGNPPSDAATGVFRIVIVGGLIAGKGQADAIQAVGYLADDGLAVELTVVGGGDPVFLQTLRRIASSDARGASVIFTERVKTALPFMRSSHVLAVCSKREGFGRVTIEAMSLGKPVVGARSGATPELVVDGFNGFLYKYGDPRDLAAKLRLLHDDRNLLEHLGENGKRWASEQFSRARYANEIDAVFSTLPKKPGMKST